MKIWLDTTCLTPQSIVVSPDLIMDDEYSGYNSQKDCDSDCDSDCDCSTTFENATRIDLATTFAHSALLHSYVLCWSSGLYVQNFVDDHWLVCNPTGTGHVIVLDQEAMRLLECFRTPQIVQSVLEHNLATLNQYNANGKGIITNTIHPNELKAERLIALWKAADLLQEVDLSLGSASSVAEHKLKVHQRTKSVNEVLTTWLHITNACNLNCQYCYVAKSQDHMPEDISREAVQAVLRSAVRNGYQKIRLKYAGGEASLRFPQVIALHDYALEQAQLSGIQLSATLLTNGVALPVRAIQLLKERHISIGLSLDGIGESHDSQRPLINGAGSFHLVDRTIQRLLQHNLPPHINITISQRNLDYLPDTLAYLLKYNLSFSLSYYRDHDQAISRAELQFSEEQMITGMRNAFAYLERHLPQRRLLASLIDKANLSSPHHYTCGVGHNYLVIDQRGQIAKCQADLAHTVTTIQAKDPLQVLRNTKSGVTTLNVDDKAECRACNWRYWCSGGCPLVTYRITGRNDVKSPNCHIYQALFPEALRLEALRLLHYTHPLNVTERW